MIGMTVVVIVVFAGSPSWHCGTEFRVLARLSTGSRSWSSPETRAGWKRRPNNNRHQSNLSVSTSSRIGKTCKADGICWYLGVLVLFSPPTTISHKSVLYCQSLNIIRPIKYKFGNPCSHRQYPLIDYLGKWNPTQPSSNWSCWSSGLTLSSGRNSYPLPERVRDLPPIIRASWIDDL